MSTLSAATCGKNSTNFSKVIPDEDLAGADRSKLVLLNKRKSSKRTKNGEEEDGENQSIPRNRIN